MRGPRRSATSVRYGNGCTLCKGFENEMFADHGNAT